MVHSDPYLIFGPIIMALMAFSLWASYTDKPWYWKAAGRRGRLFVKYAGQKAYRYFCITFSAIFLLIATVTTIAAYITQR